MLIEVDDHHRFEYLISGQATLLLFPPLKAKTDPVYGRGDHAVA